MEIIIKIEDLEKFKDEEVIKFFKFLESLSIPIKIILQINSPGMSNKIPNTNANN